MADTYTFEVRVTGKDFGAEMISPSEVAEFIVAIETMIKTIVARDNPELGISSDEVVIGLSAIRQGSLINTFVTPYEAEVSEAAERAAAAIASENYAALPLDAIDALKAVRRFNRKHATETEFWQRNGNYERLATITPKTKIVVHTFIVKGTTTLYGTLNRIGGYKPPRAWIRFIDGSTFSCRVKNRTLARQMAPLLYQRIGIRGIASWDVRDMSLHDFTIEQLLPYRQVTLTEAFNSLSEIASQHYEDIADVEAHIADIRGSNEND